MTECNVMYVAVSFFVINVLCTLFLTLLLKKINALKRYSGQNNMGREVFKLTMVGSLVYALVSTIIFAIVIYTELGADKFA